MNVQELIRELQAVPNPSVTEVRVGSASLVTAAGDFTGGASEDLFTATAHGLEDDDRVQLVAESAAGVVTGAVGDVFYVISADANTFQLSLTAGGSAVENTADGTAVFAALAGVDVDVTGADEEGIESTDAGYVEIG